VLKFEKKIRCQKVNNCHPRTVFRITTQHDASHYVTFSSLFQHQILGHWPSLNVTDQVSHPYTATGNITFLSATEDSRAVSELHYRSICLIESTLKFPVDVIPPVTPGSQNLQVPTVPCYLLAKVPSQ
jgi:hypothetical protein